MYNTIPGFNFPKGKELTTFLKDILEEEVDEKYYLNNIQIIQAKEKRKGRTFASGNKNGNMCFNRLDRSYSLALTTSSFGKTSRQENIIINNVGPRKLTPIEYCRLQGFPDYWNDNVSNSQRYKQMGNAISVPVVKALFDNLLKGKTKNT